jgi:hypothetical protein
LSIVRLLLTLRFIELNLTLPIQLGFPELPAPRSDTYFKILRLWLEDCDTGHRHCRGHVSTRLPTRLIDVGTDSAPALRLVETRQNTGKVDKYIALSHPWGDPKVHPPFCTWRTDTLGDGNTVEAFKHKILLHLMPATYRDAVAVTRALGVRHLWIDSICIIQGKDGDFNDEASCMEDVFSGAYCVLAASRATGQHDGFLAPRPARDFVTFQSLGGRPFYVCQPIDDFEQDVLQSPMNSRGWVLQERALARRTIYFAGPQNYFECGEGVRCETLSRVHK